MPAAIDITGLRFGRVVALRRASDAIRERKWLFRCDCGTVWATEKAAVTKGRTTSCGCFHREKSRQVCGDNFRKHGKSRMPEYWAWKSMHHRCSQPSNPAFHHYGGRGITVCERWGSFDAFLSDMGLRPNGLTLERRNVNGNYCPENCYWADWSTQARNKRSRADSHTA